MLEVLLPIAPIFVLIVLGHLLRRGNIPSLEFWNLNDRLVYWVLFPALLIHNLAEQQPSGLPWPGMLVVVLGTSLAASAVLAPELLAQDNLSSAEAKRYTKELDPRNPVEQRLETMANVAFYQQERSTKVLVDGLNDGTLFPDHDNRPGLSER